MANENQTTTGAQSSWESVNIISKIKWFFQKSQNSWWEQKNQRLTRAFHLTRKESIISVIVALIVVGWAIYYWKLVLDEYSTLNNRSEELKNLATYNISPNTDKLSAYIWWNTADTINWMIEINNNIEEESQADEIFKQQQKSYYEVLLQNIYLPSLNVWKDF